MGEVEELQSKLRRAGEPVDQNFATLVMNSITSESRPSERRKKWRIRRECLQRLVDNLHANSGGAAAVTVAPAVAWIPSQQPTPDLRPVVKIDVKEEDERPHKRQRIENNSYALKYTYRIYDDGSAPEMAPIHVEFVKTSVERMKSASSTRLLNSVSNCCSSCCKRHGSVEVVATICPGKVHTALKRQAVLRLPIPFFQTKSDSKPKN